MSSMDPRQLPTLEAEDKVRYPPLDDLGQPLFPDLLPKWSEAEADAFLRNVEDAGGVQVPICVDSDLNVIDGARRLWASRATSQAVAGHRVPLPGQRSAAALRRAVELQPPADVPRGTGQTYRGRVANVPEHFVALPGRTLRDQQGLGGPDQEAADRSRNHPQAEGEHWQVRAKVHVPEDHDPQQPGAQTRRGEAGQGRTTCPSGICLAASNARRVCRNCERAATATSHPTPTRTIDCTSAVFKNLSRRASCSRGRWASSRPTRSTTASTCRTGRTLPTLPQTL